MLTISRTEDKQTLMPTILPVQETRLVINIIYAPAGPGSNLKHTSSCRMCLMLVSKRSFCSFTFCRSASEQIGLPKPKNTYLCIFCYVCSNFEFSSNFGHRLQASHRPCRYNIKTSLRNGVSNSCHFPV